MFFLKSVHTFLTIFCPGDQFDDDVGHYFTDILNMRLTGFLF